MSYLQKINLRKLLTFILFLYPALMYLPFAFSNIALLVGITICILGLVTKQIKGSSFPYILYFIIIIPFLLTLISALQSREVSMGLHFVYQRYPIVVFPLLFLLLKPSLSEMKYGILSVVFMTVIGVIYSILNLIIKYPTTFHHLEHTSILNASIIQHPYMGMMSLIGIILLLNLYKSFEWNQKIVFTAIAVLTLGVIFSTSRLAYLLFIAFSFYYISKRFTGIIKISVSGIMLIGFTLFISFNSNIRHKFTNELTFENSPRLLLWNNALQLSKNNETITGVGIGDYYIKKTNTYWFKGEWELMKNNFRGLYGYECHNLYVEFLLLNGIIGILFILSIFYLLYKIIKSKNELSIWLYISLMSFMFTETLLLRQWGIIFYVFVLSLSINFNTNHISHKKMT